MLEYRDPVNDSATCTLKRQGQFKLLQSMSLLAAPSFSGLRKCWLHFRFSVTVCTGSASFVHNFRRHFSVTQTHFEKALQMNTQLIRVFFLTQRPAYMWEESHSWATKAICSLQTMTNHAAPSPSVRKLLFLHAL